MESVTKTPSTAGPKVIGKVSKEYLSITALCRKRIESMKKHDYQDCNLYISKRGTGLTAFSLDLHVSDNLACLSSFRIPSYSRDGQIPFDLHRPIALRDAHKFIYKSSD